MNTNDIARQRGFPSMAYANCLAGLLWLIPFRSPAPQAVVDNTGDSGSGTLRAAIQALNAFHGGSVFFDPNIFSHGPVTIMLTSVGDLADGPSALVISNFISISGPEGTNGLSIVRSASASNMRLLNVATNGYLNLANVTLSNGVALGPFGGGAPALGGAILNRGILNLAACTLAGNGAVGSGNDALGGALFNDRGTVTLVNCTYSANYASRSFGGNNAGLGGAVFNQNGNVSSLNVTFANNRADAGGAFYNLANNATARAAITNSILASLNGGNDFQAKTMNGGTSETLGNNNLIRQNSGFSGGIVSTADPLLAPLAFNGGPTPTHYPLRGSPVIDAGIQAGLYSVDQRGLVRVFDGDGDGIAIVDLGAVESQILRLRTVPQTSASLAQNGFQYFLLGDTYYVTEFSTNLLNWTPFRTDLLSGAEVLLTDQRATNSNRFYRVHTP